jgi:hypothetical protein
LTSTAIAVPPNPLESAYWRFEEGSLFSNVDSTVADPVFDSINQNHLDAFNVDTAPVYTNSVAPTPLRSGLSNTLALDFIPGALGGGDDLFTLMIDGEQGKGLAKNINNGIIAAGAGFTVEAAFNTNAPARFAAIVGKEGRPGLGRGLGFIENLPTFAMKTRADNSLLQVEQWDGNGNLVQVSSLASLNASQWYYAAVVNDGTLLSLYLDSNDGMGYQLQGSTALAGGALYQGVPSSPSWDNSWTVGRGQFGGAAADWFDGIIDEVRISNTALAPSEFLFAATQVVPGDYNVNGTVDAADYTKWRDNLGATITLPGEGVTPGVVTQEDYDFWKTNFGNSGTGSGAILTSLAVPEPASLSICALAISVIAVLARRQHPRLPYAC